MNVLVKMKFGSCLYGTETENSDTDYKGVFIPTKEQIFLGRIPNSYQESTKRGEGKNTAWDIDTELYSLYYFIQLACEGQTVALDMLHAPKEFWLNSSDVWEEIVLNRQKFYTKNLKAFIGYAQKQAAKYGIKGSRLENCEAVIKCLLSYPKEFKMADIWDKLPEGEHIKKNINPKNNMAEYEVCGRKIQATARLEYGLEVFKKYQQSYGARAKLAKENKGIDWKAVSHAIRAALQVKEILTKGTISFPLKDADYLLKVKLGRLDYLLEVAPILEKLVDEAKELSAKSNLPLETDRGYWNEFIVRKVEGFLYS